jgi:uncharacterized protein YbjT (DUF2867 family)
MQFGPNPQPLETRASDTQEHRCDAALAQTLTPPSGTSQTHDNAWQCYRFAEIRLSLRDVVFVTMPGHTLELWRTHSNLVDGAATMSATVRQVFIAGATGYMGSRLAADLVRHGHTVRGLVRAGSERKLPPNCRAVLGDALNAVTFREQIGGADTYVQLIGVAHPSPAKARQFREIDLESCKESLAAAVASRVRHFVYVSVAHPAPVMKAYVEVRTQCEELIRDSGLNATILRPWYVLGPGHYWPYLLKPGYWLARHISSLRESAAKLGLVNVAQMVAALVSSVEMPAQGVRIVEVPEIAASPVFRAV